MLLAELVQASICTVMRLALSVCVFMCIYIQKFVSRFLNDFQKSGHPKFAACTDENAALAVILLPQAGTLKRSLKGKNHILHKKHKMLPSGWMVDVYT